MDVLDHVIAFMGLCNLILITAVLIAIIITLFRERPKTISPKKQLLKTHLTFFETIIDYEIGRPSDEEIKRLQDELAAKANLLKKQEYEQIKLGHKKVANLCKLLWRQEDNRDNEEVTRLKNELAEIISSVKI